MARKHKPPKPVSENAVNYTVTHYAPDTSAHAAIFLDRLGFRNLHDEAHIMALSNPASHALRLALPTSLPLIHAVIERLSDITPPRHSPSPSGATTHTVSSDTAVSIAYIWFAQLAGRAAQALPPGTQHNAAYLEHLAYMPLNNNTYGGWIKQSVLKHPDCPATVLYTAALDWQLDIAKLATHHPNTPEEAHVILALRN